MFFGRKIPMRDDFLEEDEEGKDEEFEDFEEEEE